MAAAVVVIKVSLSKSVGTPNTVKVQGYLTYKKMHPLVTLP